MLKTRVVYGYTYSEMDSNKLILLIKPCQSGKSFKLFQLMGDLFEQERKENQQHTINLTFCDNSILQTVQTSTRMNNSEALSEYKTEDGELSLILSSKSAVKDHMTLATYLLEGYKNVVMCANSKRCEDVTRLISKTMKNFKFNIQIDEADKSIKLFQPYIDIWCKLNNVTNITLITATPNRLFNRLGEMRIIKLEKTYDPDIYHRFSESDFRIYDLNPGPLLYIKCVLKQNRKLIQPGTVWFIPTKTRRSAHVDVKNLVTSWGINCLIINSNGIMLYLNYLNRSEVLPNSSNTKQIEIKSSQDKEIAQILAETYKKYKLNEKPFAITGQNCVSRGVTLSSADMMITHAILPPVISNLDSTTQTSSRICGNFKHLPIWKKPIVFCTSHVKKNVSICEDRAIQLARRCYEYDQDIVNRTDYRQANSKYTFKQSAEFKNHKHAYDFLRTVYEKVSECKSHTRIEGYYVPTHMKGLNNRPVKNLLTAEHRLTKSQFDNVHISYQMTAHNRYRIYPVYKDMDAKECSWIVRYRV